MQVIQHVAEMQAVAELLRARGKRIGVVPTMGYLHEGHLSLVRLARSHCDTVIATLFVNPTQFGPTEDFERYPRDLDRDLKLAAEAGADTLFCPDTKEMYPDGSATFVDVEGVSAVLEGKFRPTHFRGVTTVVAKILNTTKPHLAVFGQKDAQQAFLVTKMARELNFDVQILVGPTVREQDGLALSSRNVYLSADERLRATALFRALKHAEMLIARGERSAAHIRSQMLALLADAAPAKIDYVAFVRPASFQETELLEPPSVLIALAVWFGSTRLIDNMTIPIS
ncbi:MAG: pantoate--beta-alanine ligase [Ignavibacteria bacterium]|nr:pantoate--beta-alanine ligase [Ignavibacteria bacterium]